MEDSIFYITIASTFVTGYVLVTSLALHNFFKYIIGQQRYKDKTTGFKLLVFYSLTLALCGIRIGEGIHYLQAAI